MLKPIHLSRIDLNLLVQFHTLLEEGHVARAAGRLNLTPSAVSHALRRLRQLLNDPLFLRTPKGVMPTARALELREPVADILARIGDVMTAAVPFAAATSSRRFVIGAPDAVMASVMVPLSECVARKAPGIDIGLLHLMPVRASGAAGHPWHDSLHKLESSAMDIAILPLSTVPARFEARRLYEEDFVVAMRKGHPLAHTATLAAFCKARHLLVSLDGDPRGFVDELLAKRGLERRIVLTAPTFMLALAHLSDSDLVAVLPRRLVEQQAARFHLAFIELPLRRKPDPVQAVATKAAMLDVGVAWLMEIIAESVASGLRSKRSA
jgi:DNA-binding transcriptional LysR family regulator